MSLTKCQAETNVIENLPDSPTLEAQELKRKFDEGSSGIKDFINSILLKEIETLVATEKRNLQTIITNEKKNLLANITEQILEDNKKKYYIGKIIIDTKNVNPATYLGFGTWQLWGAGRVPVGVNSADSDFDSVEKTGGEKSHVLTVEELAKHTHTGEYAYDAIKQKLTNYAANYGGQFSAVGVGGNAGHTIISPSAGESQAHNNMQPYITCYMWKRVS